MKIITVRQLRHRWPLYLLILPALGMICTFAYFPAVSAVYHSFFRWNGDDISEYVGLANFRRCFDDENLWAAFGVVLILIFANLFKMIPSIATAVMIHRMRSEKARYLYRVLFVIPMIIPMMVWLLLWKFFYDASFGPLNKLLNATGLMGVFEWLDSGETGLPALASFLGPAQEEIYRPSVGGVWGLGLVGVAILVARFRGRPGFRDRVWEGVRLGAVLALGVVALGVYSDFAAWNQARSAEAPDAAKVAQAWNALAYDLRGMGAIAGAMVLTIVFRRWAVSNRILLLVGAGVAGAAALLILGTTLWTEPTDVFEHGHPAWLGHPSLVLPAFIFWGFPWVGVVSVLLYLSGLGNIDQSVYDAAEIDGCGWFRKFWNVELPLITTQVRLNLILMCINTLKGWGLIFILFTDSGGPEGRLMVPGLYMFRKAFTDGEAGYASAIGLLLFFLILFLTWINNRYVRVEK